MNSACRCLNTPQFPNAIPPICRQSPKPDKLLKTKGNLSDFCLPKAENMLKISHLRESQKRTRNSKSIPPSFRLTASRMAQPKKCFFPTNEAGMLLKTLRGIWGILAYT
jgi:hypothetical protein